MRAKHSKELGEMTWSNIESRPDLQIRTMVLMMQDNYKFFSKPEVSTYNRLAFSDSGYNSGNGAVTSDRRACKLAGSCDVNVWFGQVEKYCTRSKLAIYGNRSPCDINRTHVRDNLLLRSNKYKIFFD